MRIIELSVENFKKISAVRINPDGTVVTISGRNGAGKSSILDAVVSAMAGAKHAPDMPIRRGAEEARIVLETEDLRVTRRWMPRHKLVVEQKRGDGWGPPELEPQSILDKLFGAGLGFDPGAFSRMKPKEQAALLRQVTGLDTREIDARRQEIFKRRTDVNREAEQLKAQRAAISIPPDPGDVGEERDLAAIAGQRAECERIRAENVRACESLVRATQNLERLRDDVRQLEAKLERARAVVAANERDVASIEAAVAVLVDPDTTVVDRAIAEAKEHNAQVRQQQRLAHEFRRQTDAYAKATKACDAKEAFAKALTEELAAIDREKADMLAAAVMPVAGLSISENDEVMLNGVPIDGASQAEKIRLGLAIGVALNPKFRVLLCHDASLLDEDSMRLVGEFAEANDCQVFLERVGREGTIVVEDGALVEQETAVEAAAS